MLSADIGTYLDYLYDADIISDSAMELIEKCDDRKAKAVLLLYNLITAFGMSSDKGESSLVFDYLIAITEKHHKELMAVIILLEHCKVG